MWKMLKKQFMVQWQDSLVAAAVMCGAWLFGIVLHALLHRYEPGKTFPMGTLLAVIAALFFTLFMEIGKITLYFNMEVAMGQTRQTFYATHVVCGLAWALLYTAVLILLCAAERALYVRIYPAKAGIDLFAYVWRWAFPVLAALNAFGDFSGVLLMRFGRTAGWFLWGFWMVLSLGVPRVFEAANESPDSGFGRLGGVFLRIARAVPPGWQQAIPLLLAAAAFAGTWAFLRRQQAVI